MNVNINNKNLFSQSLLINKFFFQKNFSKKQIGITTLDSVCQYRNNNYYYNKDGVPFEVVNPRTSKELLEALQEGEDILNGKVKAKSYTNMYEMLNDLKD